MPFTPAKKILIKTDTNEIEYTKTIKNKTGEIMYEYKYVKSKTKLGTVICFSEKDLIKLLGYSFKII